MKTGVTLHSRNRLTTPLALPVGFVRTAPSWKRDEAIMQQRERVLD